MNILKTNTMWDGEDSLSDMSVCPGEFAKERLEQFHESWVSESEQPDGDAKQMHTFTEEDFHIGRFIGEGGFANVIRVFSKSSYRNHANGNNVESGQAFALKRLKDSVLANRTMLTIAA